MDSIGNYWLFWSLYLAAATCFTAIFWRITRFERAIWTSYNLRGLAVAIIFTPWYSNPQESVMAPALMVAALDAITGGFDAAFRSFVPLVLALVVALIVAAILALAKKRNTNKFYKNRELKDKDEVV
jgi:hypothetical protein